MDKFIFCFFFMVYFNFYNILKFNNEVYQFGFSSFAFSMLRINFSSVMGPFLHLTRICLKFLNDERKCLYTVAYFSPHQKICLQSFNNYVLLSKNSVVRHIGYSLLFIIFLYIFRAEIFLTPHWLYRKK